MFFRAIIEWSQFTKFVIFKYVSTEYGDSLSDLGRAFKLLGACEVNALGKAFSELGTKSEAISTKLQKEVGLHKNSLYLWFFQ